MSLMARYISFSLIHPDGNILNLKNTRYEKYLYLTIPELQSKCISLTSDSQSMCSSYLEDNGTMEYHPSLSFLYDVHLEEIISICEIIRYKMLCRDRFFSNSSISCNSRNYTEKLIVETTSNPYLSYFELLDLFPDEEIELIIENLIENKKLKYTKIHTGKNKGKSVISIK